MTQDAPNTSSSTTPDQAGPNPAQTPPIPVPFLKPYDPIETEPRIQAWERNDANPKESIYNPDTLIARGITDPEAPSASIILPPPNVTGTLHLGHGLMVTIQDILMRKARMEGKKVLWIPGTDHAAIATQSVVEKEISKKEGKSRYDIGREGMLRRIGDFANQSHDTIVSQVKRMGASLDWSREAFTLDDARNVAVRTMFKRMFDDGLIYRGFRIVNWDPKGQTTIADDELVYKEETSKFYYFKYGPFTIGTARPETKFGDKYVVMHPEDARYTEYSHGQKITVEWINGPIEATIIKDESIDMEFGTGVMTITPWHSAVDFALAEKYKLEKEQIIDKYGKLLPIAGPEFTGMKISEAREKIVAKLTEKGLVEKIEENYIHNISTAERTGGVIEPQVMNQWFVAVNTPFTIPHSEIKGIESGSQTTLKEIMRKAVDPAFGHKVQGPVDILPDHFNKTYFHWIDNLNDWCISRQIWYGHRIPIWYRSKSGQVLDKTGELHPSNPDIEMYCGTEAPADDTQGAWIQDEDTLDTWFSSGLWSFSTLGWPATQDPNTCLPIAGSDLATYHPTTILVTGYEILFFWVARMILMTGYGLGTIPFKTVYLNGTIRDSQGRKMSKSLGNGGDPIQISDKYGADALRMFYAMSNTPGTDSRIYEDKIKGFKHFANKVWNITRFVLTAIAENPHAKDQKFNPDFFTGIYSPEAYTGPTEQDRMILAEWRTALKAITEHLDAYRIHLAAEELYGYLWRTFADKILEESKPILKPGFADMLDGNTDGDDTIAEKIIESDQLDSTDLALKRQAALSRAQTLMTILRESILVLHPFMPHVTQEIWTLLPQEMRKDELTHGMIAIEKWPTYHI
jgi:valyl-tRNA synthetase